MAMVAGTVTVDASGNPSGAGLSRAVYDAMAAAFGVDVLAPPSAPAAQQQLAHIANAIGAAVVDHIVANAVVTVAPGIAVTTTGGTGSTTGTGTGSIA